MVILRIKQLLMIGVLLAATSCSCFLFCYDDTSIQTGYVSDRDSCQSEAERKVSLFSRVTKSAKERNATLLALFADCMHKKNWGVTSPKQEKKKGDKKNDKKDASNFPGIPPATPAIRNDDAQRQEEIRRQQQELSRQQQQQMAAQQRQQQQYYQQQEQVRQQQQQMRANQPPREVYRERIIEQQAAPQQQQQQRQQQAAPPPRDVYRERIIEKQAPPPPQRQQPQIIQREIIREVPARPQAQPPTQIIEKHYIDRRPAPAARPQAAPPPAQQIIRNQTQNNYYQKEITQQTPAMVPAPRVPVCPPGQVCRPLPPQGYYYPPRPPIFPPARTYSYGGG